MTCKDCIVYKKSGGCERKKQYYICLIDDLMDWDQYMRSAGRPKEKLIKAVVPL